MAQRLLVFLFFLGLNGCLPFSNDPKPGPDKQFVGTAYGATEGAATGAVLGFQLTAATGPGAWIGGGLGAVYGMFTGIAADMIEDQDMRSSEAEYALREKAWIQEVLSEHYAKRLELHPDRDIFPADLFFANDEVELKPEARLLVRELAEMTKSRMPWSRIVIASYTMSADNQSTYAEFLNQRRADTIAVQFVQAGIDPHRLSTQAVTTADVLVADPYDSPDRYRQAIEIIPVDH